MRITQKHRVIFIKMCNDFEHKIYCRLLGDNLTSVKNVILINKGW